MLSHLRAIPRAGYVIGGHPEHGKTTLKSWFIIIHLLHADLRLTGHHGHREALGTETSPTMREKTAPGQTATVL